MKRFSKTFLAVAAVSAISAAMAVSASAMTASYADGTVTLSDVNSSGASQTLLILSEDNETVATTDIVQIDQKDDGNVFTLVPVGTLESGKTYYVRVGGSDGQLQNTTFTVDGSRATKEITIGDATADGRVNASDTTAIGRYLANLRDSKYKNTTVGEKHEVVETGATVTIGDATADGRVNASDTTAIGRYLANLRDPKYKNTTVGDKVEVYSEPIE